MIQIGVLRAVERLPTLKKPFAAVLLLHFPGNLEAAGPFRGPKPAIHPQCVLSVQLAGARVEKIGAAGACALAQRAPTHDVRRPRGAPAARVGSQRRGGNTTASLRLCGPEDMSHLQTARARGGRHP